MRISDWSSDVCSSDLSSAPVEVVIARPQPLVSPGIHVSANRGGAAYAPENTMMAFRNAARLGADDFKTGTWLTADGALVLLHDQELSRTTNRSEEHTSELQSLMRTSYAVFCLKKQKNKITRTST